MKKMLVIAVAAALVAPAAAMADTTLYGKLHASVGSVDNGAGSETIVESHASRLGVKGSTELDNGLSATYGLEYGLNLDGDSSRALSARNTFAGVKGGFGEVRIGRHDTPAKLATAGLDAFADTYGAMENIIATDGHRVDNAVAYINKFGPVGFAIAHSTAPLNEDVGAAVDTAANTAMVNYGNGPMYAGLGYTDVKNVGSTANLGLGWKAEAGHFANLVYEQAEGDGANTAAVASATGIPAAGAKDTNVYVAGGYKTGAATLKVGYGEGKRDGAGKEKQTSVGVDYSLGKKTSAYLLWNEDKNLSRAAVEASTDKQTATVVGIVSEF
ncbi:porin [Thiothrix nivea]|uniref:Porin Gram-negative type n=1 Tax=Thiothrix nivea (strain ATCC 35100 / DSM 5205 / JP2) TaxID=870187 RepID=A0A656HGD1_THINJ|nr:porin [Thiothrix nivea]EIJ36081.1 porin Gram-negative type [Thiothrix nivea DSM 5205]